MKEKGRQTESECSRAAHSQLVPADELGTFGRTENDSREDFKNVYSFREAFVEPYIPRAAPRVERKTKPGAEVRN